MLVPNKKRTFIPIFGLLLLTTEFISASHQQSSDYDASSTQHKLLESLVVPVPNIIAQLSRFMGSEMGKLALAESNPSLLTKSDNVQEFKESLKKISQQFSGALKKINNYVKQVASRIASSNFNEILDYTIKHSKLDSFALNVPGFLRNELNQVSDSIVFLSNETSSELQKVSNLTKAFAKTVKAFHSAKFATISNEFETITNQKNTIEKEIISLNEEHEKLSRNLTDVENRFYELLNTTHQAIQGKKQIGNKLSCYENRLLDYKLELLLKVKDCKEKATTSEIITINILRSIKKQWTTAVENLTENEMILTKKREENYKLSIEFQKLEHKENGLGQNFPLHFNLTLIDQLEKEVKELVVGWSNLVSYCQNIQSEVAAIRATPELDTTIINGQFTKEIQQFDMIRKDINLVDKMANFFIKVYQSSLTSLVDELDEMMNHENPATLEKNLINSCTIASLKIEIMQMRERWDTLLRSCTEIV